MDKVINFIIENWRFLSVSFLLLVSLILTIVKKTKVNVLPDTVLADLYMNLVIWINDAEALYSSEPKSGDKKMKFVLLRCREFLNRYHCELSVGFIQSIVEDFLSTPQKKG